MFRVSLIGADTPQLQAVQRFAQDYPTLARLSVEQNVIPRIDQRVDRDLRQFVPPPAQKPIQWTSEKQRKAYFATDGFGHGIPYVRRKPGIEAEWRVDTVVNAAGVRISIVNDDPASPFVYGRWKQQFHTNTGWPDARPIIDRIAADARPQVVADQIVLARAGIRGLRQRIRQRLGGGGFNL